MRDPFPVDQRHYDSRSALARNGSYILLGSMQEHVSCTPKYHGCAEAPDVDRTSAGGHVDIVRVEESDLAAISLLHRHFWDKPSDVDAMSQTVRALCDDPDHLFLAARIDGECVGTATGVVCHGLYGGFDAYLVIEDVVVDEAYRRQGVASALVGELERFACRSGCRQMIVLSESVRLDAHGLYGALGFESRWTGFKKKLNSD